MHCASTRVPVLHLAAGGLGIDIKRHDPYRRIIWHCPNLQGGGVFRAFVDITNYAVIVSVRRHACLSVDSLIRCDELAYALSWAIPPWALWAVAASQWEVCIEPQLVLGYHNLGTVTVVGW